MEKKIKKVLLVGRTGCGKSSAGNALVGDENFFKVGHNVISETFDIKSKVVHYENGEIIDFIDTPGFCDSENREGKFLLDLVKFLRSLSKGLTYVLVLLNISEPRFDQKMKDMLFVIEKLLGEDAWKHTFFITSFWNSLNEDGYKNAEKRNLELRESLKKHLKLQHDPVMIPFNSSKPSDFRNEILVRCFDKKEKYIPQISHDIDNVIGASGDINTQMSNISKIPQLQAVIQKFQQDLANMKSMKENLEKALADHQSASERKINQIQAENKEMLSNMETKYQKELESVKEQHKTLSYAGDDDDDDFCTIL